MSTNTLQYLNHVLPFQRSVSIKRQADILGVEPTISAIVSKILDTHLEEVLICTQSGIEAPLTGNPASLVTVTPLLDSARWTMNLVFPISGPRLSVLSKLKTLKVSKR